MKQVLGLTESDISDLGDGWKMDVMNGLPSYIYGTLGLESFDSDSHHFGQYCLLVFFLTSENTNTVEM